MIASRKHPDATAPDTADDVSTVHAPHTPADPDAATVKLADDVRLVIGRLARRLRQETSAGLTPSQQSAMAVLDRDGPLRLSELAATERVAAPTITKVVAGLEAHGLVERAEDPTDRRSSLVHLSPKGRDTLTNLRTERTAALVHLLHELSAPERGAIEAVLPVLAKLAEGQRKPDAR